MRLQICRIIWGNKNRGSGQRKGRSTTGVFRSHKRRQKGRLWGSWPGQQRYLQPEDRQCSSLLICQNRDFLSAIAHHFTQHLLSTSYGWDYIAQVHELPTCEKISSRVQKRSSKGKRINLLEFLNKVKNFQKSHFPLFSDPWLEDHSLKCIKNLNRIYPVRFLHSKQRFHF